MCLFFTRSTPGSDDDVLCGIIQTEQLYTENTARMIILIGIAVNINKEKFHDKTQHYNPES